MVATVWIGVAALGLIIGLVGAALWMRRGRHEDRDGLTWLIPFMGNML